MLRTIRAVIESDGSERLLEPVSLAGTRRALVTILDEEDQDGSMSTALLSEPALPTGTESRRTPPGRTCSGRLRPSPGDMSDGRPERFFRAGPSS